MSAVKTRFRCTSQRIGRTRRDFDFDIHATDAQDLAEQLYRLVRPFLASRHFDVDVDLEEGMAWIGWGRMGQFEIEAVSS